MIKALLRRIIISALRDEAGKIKRFDGTGLPGETFKNREQFQHYGFTSNPVDDQIEGIVLGIGNVFYLIAEDDRRYRIVLQKGEVALYTDEGDKIHLKRGKEIEIKGQSKVVVNSPVVELGNGALNRLIDERVKTTWADVHTHPYTDDGAPMQTGAPTQPLDLSGCATEKTTGS